jgi:quercetin 2,3-dioxygenase
MSGPVTTVDAPTSRAAAGQVETACVQVLAAREATVGRLRVRRALPRLGRRTVGAWCFADHVGPAEVTETAGLDIGPHPHTSLQTVTWLVEGEVLHRDSLGSEQLIRPGQLNLMTAGRGVAHSEEASADYHGILHGIQLWVAQPEDTRHGPAAFEHHAALPQADVDNSHLTVLVGAFGGLESPARHDTPLVGVDAVLRSGRSAWPLRNDFEYALIVLDGAIDLGQRVVEPGQLAYLGQGRDALDLSVREPTRALLLGGEPFDEPLLMWWNFVGRTREEIEVANAQWESEDPRFGRVASPLARIAAPPLVWRSEAS